MEWLIFGTQILIRKNIPFKIVKFINLDMDRVWSIDCVKDNSNIIGIGFDEGTVVIKIGSDEPVVSLKLFILN